MKRCAQCATSFNGKAWRCPSCSFAPNNFEHNILSFCKPQGSDGFDPDAFAHLAQLEHESFWFRSRNRLIVWAVRKYFPSASHLLEIGCGTGFVLEGLTSALPLLRLSGADLHADGLRHAATRVANVELFQLDARTLPFAGEFDVIGAFDMLEDVDADERVLAEMHTALKPGGGIVLTVPQHPWLWSAADDYGEHKRRYRRKELIDKVVAAGFAVRRVTSFVSLLLPGMAAVRVRDRLSRRTFNPSREHQAARSIGRPLESISDFERSLIARGVNLPAGGSLLLIAGRV